VLIESIKESRAVDRVRKGFALSRTGRDSLPDINGILQCATIRSGKRSIQRKFASVEYQINTCTEERNKRPQLLTLRCKEFSNDALRQPALFERVMGLWSTRVLFRFAAYHV